MSKCIVGNPFKFSDFMCIPSDSKSCVERCPLFQQKVREAVSDYLGYRPDIYYGNKNIMKTNNIGSDDDYTTIKYPFTQKFLASINLSRFNQFLASDNIDKVNNLIFKLHSSIALESQYNDLIRILLDDLLSDTTHIEILRDFLYYFRSEVLDEDLIGYVLDGSYPLVQVRDPLIYFVCQYALTTMGAPSSEHTDSKIIGDFISKLSTDDECSVATRLFSLYEYYSDSSKKEISNYIYRCLSDYLDYLSKKGLPDCALSILFFGFDDDEIRKLILSHIKHANVETQALANKIIDYYISKKIKEKIVYLNAIKITEVGIDTDSLISRMHKECSDSCINDIINTISAIHLIILWSLMNNKLQMNDQQEQIQDKWYHIGDILNVINRNPQNRDYIRSRFGPFEDFMKATNPYLNEYGQISSKYLYDNLLSTKTYFEKLNEPLQNDNAKNFIKLLHDLLYESQQTKRKILSQGLDEILKKYGITIDAEQPKVQPIKKVGTGITHQYYFQKRDKNEAIYSIIAKKITQRKILIVPVKVSPAHANMMIIDTLRTPNTAYYIEPNITYNFENKHFFEVTFRESVKNFSGSFIEINDIDMQKDFELCYSWSLLLSTMIVLNPLVDVQTMFKNFSSNSGYKYGILYIFLYYVFEHIMSKFEPYKSQLQNIKYKDIPKDLRIKYKHSEVEEEGDIKVTLLKDWLKIVKDSNITFAQEGGVIYYDKYMKYKAKYFNLKSK
jgi:hypothetical protein